MVGCSIHILKIFMSALSNNGWTMYAAIQISQGVILVLPFIIKGQTYCLAPQYQRFQQAFGGS
jgi:hypothetical protein